MAKSNNDRGPKAKPATKTKPLTLFDVVWPKILTGMLLLLAYEQRDWMVPIVSIALVINGIIAYRRGEF